MKEISSIENPKVKNVASLSKKKYRDKEGCYLIEGPNLLEEALKNNGHVRSAFFQLEALKKSTELQRLQKEMEEKEIPVFGLSPGLFQKLSDTDAPQGVLAEVEKWVHSEADFFFSKKEENVGNLIVLDRIQDPGNLGTILRTADGAGFMGAILMKGCGDIYSPKVVRATAGTLFRLPILLVDTPKEALELLRKYRKRIFATALDSSLFYFRCDLCRDAAIVIGNEGNGICQEFLNGADQKIKIPMEGKIESLNAGVAAGILIYETVRQGYGKS